LHHPNCLGPPLSGQGSHVLSVVFSQVGRILAIGSDDNTVLLWDLTDRGTPRRLGRHLLAFNGQVNSVMFARTDLDHRQQRQRGAAVGPDRAE
jgi:WD40 repeat protein